MTVPVISPVRTPVTRAVEKLRKFFEQSLTRYQLYEELIKLDPELQGAISTASIIVSKCLKSYTVNPGKELEKPEQEMLDELSRLYVKLSPYFYDVAYKLYRDGDTCCVVDVVKGIGIRELKWLPITKLTVLEDKAQLSRFDVPTQEANWYCLNEVPTVDGKMGQTQWFPAKNVVHFNWKRAEEILDNYNRKTLGIFTHPPLEALSISLIRKFSIQINDMLLREVLVPREHHKLPSEAFSPDNFAGDTYEDRVKAAQNAAQAAIDAYVRKLEQRRVDRGYVTLDNTEINIIEPKMSYTDPNPLIEQLNQSINSSIGTPESVVSGRTARRGSFASEVAVSSYFVAKAEFLAKLISRKLIELAKRHLTVKYGTKYEKYYDEIDFKLQLIFYPSEMARILAVLTELELFTDTELRDMFGFPPLRVEQRKEIQSRPRRHGTTPAEVAAHLPPVKKIPETPHTTSKRQKTESR